MKYFARLQTLLSRLRGRSFQVLALSVFVRESPLGPIEVVMLLLLLSHRFGGLNLCPGFLLHNLFIRDFEMDKILFKYVALPTHFSF